MTKKEAMQALVRGDKVSHDYFSDNEFVFMDENGKIKDEGGYIHDKFWFLRQNDSWATGWKLYTIKKLTSHAKFNQ